MSAARATRGAPISTPRSSAKRSTTSVEPANRPAVRYSVTILNFGLRMTRQSLPHGRAISPITAGAGRSRIVLYRPGTTWPRSPITATTAERYACDFQIDRRRPMVGAAGGDCPSDTGGGARIPAAGDSVTPADAHAAGGPA